MPELKTLVARLLKRTRPAWLLPGLLVLLVLVAVVYSIWSFLPFHNPDFACPILPSLMSRGTDAIHYGPDGHPRGPAPTSFSDLQTFCTDMRQAFARSGLTNGEAAYFFALFREADYCGLERHNDFGNPFAGSRKWWLPSPVRPISWHKQMMVRKITDEQYEIYTYRYDCWMPSVLYERMAVELEDGAIQRCTLIERWQEVTFSGCP